ncbi:MAG: hypothetical protein WDZ79_02270 [Candidatus Paceibacterota bacterium]
MVKSWNVRFHTKTTFFEKETTMSEITLDVGLAYKIKQALSRNGIPDVADLDWLATGDNIAQMRRVRLGHAEIIGSEHVIDCDADPFVPGNWTVEEHQKGGQFKWDKNAQKDALYLSKGQTTGSKYIEGNKLRKELADKPVLNANVLDYLLVNPHLIPEEWKGKLVFFWGTVYRNQRGRLCVRYLDWDGDVGWGGRALWLVGEWFGRYPAAVSAPAEQWGYLQH